MSHFPEERSRFLDDRHNPLETGYLTQEIKKVHISSGKKNILSSGKCDILSSGKCDILSSLEKEILFFKKKDIFPQGKGHLIPWVKGHFSPRKNTFSPLGKITFMGTGHLYHGKQDIYSLEKKNIFPPEKNYIK